jgi:GNAT superfamily N-acetyltransferase
MMQDLLPAGGYIRKLWPNETATYRDHLLRLDAESRRARFGGAVSDEFIGDYVNVSLSLDEVVHGFFVNGTLRGAAELRAIRSDRDADAEAAFSIEKPWQDHGVGSALLAHTLLAARNRGIRRLHMICLAENRRMQQLARKFEAELTFEYGSVVGEVEAPYPTPTSVLREVFADSAGFATAMLDVQSRMLRGRKPEPA